MNNLIYPQNNSHFRGFHIFMNHDFQYYLPLGMFFRPTAFVSFKYDVSSTWIKEHHKVHLYYSREFSCMTNGALERFIKSCNEITEHPVFIHVPKDCKYLRALLKEQLGPLEAINNRLQPRFIIIPEHRGEVGFYFYNYDRNFVEKRYEQVYLTVQFEGDCIISGYIRRHHGKTVYISSQRCH